MLMGFRKEVNYSSETVTIGTIQQQQKTKNTNKTQKRRGRKVFG